MAELMVDRRLVSWAGLPAMADVTEEIGRAEVTAVGRLVMERPVTAVGRPLVGRMLVGSTVLMLPRLSVVREGMAVPTMGIGMAVVATGSPVVGRMPAEDTEARIETKEEVMPVGSAEIAELGSTPSVTALVTGLVTGLAEDRAARVVMVIAR